ncbi:MAG: hypothetical protein VCC01_09240 [Candidatus Hydrogenedentota bacterium]
MHRHITFSLITATLLVSSAHGKEFLYIHNTYSEEISKISIPEHEVVGEIEIGFYMDYVNKSPDNKTLYVNRIKGDLPGSRARNIGVSGELIAIDTATANTPTSQIGRATIFPSSTQKPTRRSSDSLWANTRSAWSSSKYPIESDMSLPNAPKVSGTSLKSILKVSSLLLSPLFPIDLTD